VHLGGLRGKEVILAGENDRRSLLAPDRSDLRIIFAPQDEVIVGYRRGPSGSDVLWVCPRCHDEGRIAAWEGTFWDNGDIAEHPS
jgi:hypothetical protein